MKIGLLDGKHNKWVHLDQLAYQHLCCLPLSVDYLFVNQLRAQLLLSNQRGVLVARKRTGEKEQEGDDDGTSCISKLVFKPTEIIIKASDVIIDLEKEKKSQS